MQPAALVSFEKARFEEISRPVAWCFKGSILSEMTYGAWPFEADRHFAGQFSKSCHFPQFLHIRCITESPK
jgi:hypothetical protein